MADVPSCPKGEETRQEPCIEQAAKNLLLDEDISDISLTCTDGKVVRANRAFLAARSVVFRKMLYGNFAEADQETIRVGYTGDVIQAVVEHICTNESKKLSEIAKDATPVVLSSETLVSIASAALFFFLPALYGKSSNLSVKLMEEYRGFACHVLELCRAMGLTFDDSNDFSHLALKKARENPSVLLDETVLPHISHDTLAEILQGDQINANELTLFNIIKKWCECGGDTGENGNDGGSGDELSHPHKTRQHQASNLTSYIRLENIDPSELASVVVPSGLVSQEQLSEAYKAQASVAVCRGKFACVRGKHWWEDSTDVWTPGYNCVETKVVECPTMISGTFQWTVKFLRHCAIVWLGIASTSKPIIRSKFLCCQEGGWAYGSDGSTWNVDEGLHTGAYPIFGERAEVTFVLDLSSEAQAGGTLTAFVNNRRGVQLFTNLLKHVRDGEGFLPAASLFGPASVQLVKFEKTSD